MKATFIIRNSYFIILKCRVAQTEASKAIKLLSWSIYTRCRNIDLLSIGYAFQPHLRTD